MVEACLNSRGRARGGGEEVARGRRRVRAPARGTTSAGVAKAHGKRWEGDEEGPDERLRLTESSNAREREGEEDRSEEEDDGHSGALFGHWHGFPEKKTEGASGPEERGHRGETVGH